MSLFTEPKIIKVRDKEISVSPLAVKNISKAATAAAPLVGVFSTATVDPTEVLKNADAVITLVALATNQPEEFIGELNIAELTEVLTLVISVNSSFFIQTALPQIQALIQQVGQIAESQTPKAVGKKA